MFSDFEIYLSTLKYWFLFPAGWLMVSHIYSSIGRVLHVLQRRGHDRWLKEQFEPPIVSTILSKGRGHDRWLKSAWFILVHFWPCAVSFSFPALNLLIWLLASSCSCSHSFPIRVGVGAYPDERNIWNHIPDMPSLCEKGPKAREHSGVAKLALKWNLFRPRLTDRPDQLARVKYWMDDLTKFDFHGWNYLFGCPVWISFRPW